MTDESPFSKYYQKYPRHGRPTEDEVLFESPELLEAGKHLPYRIRRLNPTVEDDGQA